MTGLELTIAGATKSIQPDWRISETLNGRNVMEFTVKSGDGTYRPAARAAVVFEVPATIPEQVLFKGLVHDISETGWAGHGTTAIDNRVGAVDYNAYADRRYIELTIPGGDTLKDGLTVIAGALADYGVSLDAGQVDGPTFTDPVVFTLQRVTEILDRLSVITGYAWDISYGKKLSMYVPGTTAAPFNIAAGDGNAIGDITVTPSLSDYANVVRVRYSSYAVSAFAYLVTTGNFSDTEQVTVGGKTYTFQATLTDSNGNVKIGASAIASLNNLIGAINLNGTAGTDYALSMTGNSQVTAGIQGSDAMRAVAITPGAAGNSIACSETCANALWGVDGFGTTTTLQYGADEELSMWAIATTSPAAADRVEAVRDHPEVHDLATAQALADGYLARLQVVPQEVHYRTLTDGLHPGMSQSIVEAKRNLNSANCLITAVDITAVGNVVWYDVTAVTELVIPTLALDTYKHWGGAGGGGTVSGGGGIVPGIPNTLIVDNGTFAGQMPTLFGDGGIRTIVDAHQPVAKLAGFFAFKSAQNQTNGPQALEAYTYMNQTGTTTLGIACIGNIEHAGSGTATSMRSFTAGLLITSTGGGTDAICYSADVQGRVAGGSGTYTNGYGFYVGTFGAGFTNKWSLKSTDTTATLENAGPVVMGGAARMTGAISPAQLTADTHNWNPTGLSNASVIRVDIDAARSLTGIVAQASGTMLMLYNVSTFALTIPHDDASSSAANRFYCPDATTFTIRQKANALFRYDGTHSRWTLVLR